MNPLTLTKELFFPRLCNACEATMQSYENHICTSCQLTLPKIPLDENYQSAVSAKFWGKIKVKNTYSFLQFTKNGAVQHILHELKYKNKPDLAKYMGNWFGNELKHDGFQNEIDLIIGIPLHRIKEKRRGYNQADCFAEGLSEALNVPFSKETLRRDVYTETQTKRARFNRFENMDGVFAVQNPDLVKGKRIALVDDVLTTGATLEVAGKELIDGGCQELSILTIAAAV